MSTVPPLSQSRQALLACPLFYVQQIIKGKDAPESIAAVRGRVVHAILCKYVRELSRAGLSKRPEYFDTLLHGLPADAREILEQQRDRIEINPEEIYMAELYCAMSDDFRPWKKTMLAGIEEENGPRAYESTLDLVLVKDPSAATIIDWKSQFQAVDPDTFQARLYSLQLFMLNPQFEKVTFELRFVRWGGKARAVAFNREDVPKLQAEARRYREMQIQLHKEASEDGFEPRVFAGAHCVYCPLLGNGCPVEENPAEDVTTSMQKVLYYRLALKKFEPIVKEHCNAFGPVTHKDGAGNVYEAFWDTTEEKKISIDALPVIQKWAKAREKDFLEYITLSGISGKLKAKKRADLADAVANFVTMKVKPKFRIGRAGETEDEVENGREA